MTCPRIIRKIRDRIAHPLSGDRMTWMQMDDLAKRYAEEYMPETDSHTDQVRYDNMINAARHFLRWLRHNNYTINKI